MGPFLDFPKSRPACRLGRLLCKGEAELVWSCCTDMEGGPCLLAGAGQRVERKVKDDVDCRRHVSTSRLDAMKDEDVVLGVVFVSIMILCYGMVDSIKKYFPTKCLRRRVTKAGSLTGPGDRLRLYLPCFNFTTVAY